VFTATPADESTRRLLDNLERSVVSRESLAAVIQKAQSVPARSRPHVPRRRNRQDAETHPVLSHATRFAVESRCAYLRRSVRLLRPPGRTTGKRGVAISLHGRHEHRSAAQFTLDS